MKKALSIILALAMCLSLCACAAKPAEVDPAEKTREAFESSKKAFGFVTEAYLATNEFSSDLYEAWRLGINEKSSYDSDSDFEDFAAEMHIEQEHIEQAVANLWGKEAFEYGDWSRLPYLYNGSCFSAWVSVISEAYKCSGKVGDIEAKLNEAKKLMKELGNEYSDYEHYPVLKKYFTNTIAFLDFCRSPEGSFDQVVETFNSYRNYAREYFFDMNYVFNDSIAGMEPETDDEPENEAEAEEIVAEE